MSSNIFSLAVFEENVKVFVIALSLPGVLCKNLTFSYISVISKDIYLKLILVVTIKRGTIPVEQVTLKLLLT